MMKSKVLRFLGVIGIGKALRIQGDHTDTTDELTGEKIGDRFSTDRSSEYELSRGTDTDDFESDAIAIRFRNSDTPTPEDSEDELKRVNSLEYERKINKKKKGNRLFKSKAKELRRTLEANKRMIAQSQGELEALQAENRRQKRLDLKERLLSSGNHHNKKRTSELGPNTKRIICGVLVVLGGVTIGCILGILTPWQGNDDDTIPFIICSESVVVDDFSTTSDCSIIEGDLMVDTSFTGDFGVLTLFPRLVEVEGSLIIENVDGLRSVTFEADTETIRIGGNVDCTDNIGLEHVMISSVDTIMGNVNFERNNVLREVSLVNLETVFSLFIFRDNDLLETVSAPNLRRACSSFLIEHNRALVHIGFSSLQSVGSFLKVGDNDALPGFEFPALISTSGNWFIINHNPSMLYFHLPFFVSTSGEIRVYNNALLEEINFPRLTTVARWFQVANNQVLKRVSLPLFQSALSRFYIDNNNELEEFLAPSLTSILAEFLVTRNKLNFLDMRSLRSVGQYILVQNNNALTNLNFNSLNSVGGYITVNNNEALVSFNLPVFQSMTNEITIENNDVLENVGLASLEYLGRTLSLTSNPLFTTISMVGLETVRAFEISSCPILENICLIDQDNCIPAEALGSAVEANLTRVCHEVLFEGNQTYRNEDHYQEGCSEYDRNCNCLS